MFADNATLQAAILACGGEDNRNCLFDVALTGNEDVGKLTLSSQQTFDENVASASKYAARCAAIFGVFSEMSVV